MRNSKTPDSTLLTARSIDAEMFPEAYRLLKASISPRRLPPRTALEARFQEPLCDAMLFDLGHGNPIGVSVGWPLFDFYFLEYLAFTLELPSKSYATRWLETLKDQHRNVVLAIDPHDDLAFYKSHGFTLLDDDCLMPSMRANEKPLPMLLFSSSLELDPKTTLRTIYREVYRHALLRPQNSVLRSFLHDS